MGVEELGVRSWGGGVKGVKDKLMAQAFTERGGGVGGGGGGGVGVVRGSCGWGSHSLCDVFVFIMCCASVALVASIHLLLS